MYCYVILILCRFCPQQSAKPQGHQQHSPEWKRSLVEDGKWRKSGHIVAELRQWVEQGTRKTIPRYDVVSGALRTSHSDK